MAWLYKHPRSQFWQIGWRVGNKLFNRSTKVANRADAEKKLALFDLMADASREKRLSEDFFNSLTGRELGRIALRAAVETYLDSFKGQNTESSLVSYKCRLNAFLEYFHAGDTAADWRHHRRNVGAILERRQSADIRLDCERLPQSLRVCLNNDG